MTEPGPLQLDAQGQLQFPCVYPVKALTRVRERALEQLLEEIARHARLHDPDRIQIRPSRNGRFQSVTLELHVESRAQLESVYASLRALDIVVMTL
ncbi:MAG: DUF493 domain-containing protein [Gammaproteobacteria bacterium HGW-Gammaproteobacteria-8]|nr:MAG: DUF493 domain-containing protein [Gammaproteobacteria bacterium HGW-Gammaproteobacteria-8]